MKELSDVQLRILRTLSDGLPHKWEEMRVCLQDELADRSVLNSQIKRIRATLRPRGEDIVVQFIQRQRQYRHVRLLHSPGDGCR